LTPRPLHANLAPVLTINDIIRRPVVWIVAVLVVVLAGGAVVAYRTLTTPVPQELHLTDGTEVYFLSDTKVEPSAAYPRTREIRLDGDAFFRAPAGTAPLIVRTRLFVLTVTGDSAFRVTAWARESGEQVEVLNGHVQANKAYPSTYNEPDILEAGDMSMVNQTIDLMEKETFDREQLRQWSEALIASVKQQRAASSP
jgi:ferric-dicitrate binding protein FerR (iron transport regulator)